MITAETIEMSRLVGVVDFQPHHACRTVDAECHLGQLVAAELFATAIHGSPQ